MTYVLKWFSESHHQCLDIIYNQTLNLTLSNHQNFLFTFYKIKPQNPFHLCVESIKKNYANYLKHTIPLIFYRNENVSDMKLELFNH